MRKQLDGPLLFWAIAAAALLTYCAFTRAQPADPEGPTRPVPEAKALRDAADSAASFMEAAAVDLRWKEGQLAQLQTQTTALQQQVERLKAQAWTQWTPQTQLVPGGMYALPDDQPINIVLDKPKVTLVGGKNLYGGGTRPGILILASDCELRDVNANKSAAPAGTARLGLAEFIAVGSESKVNGPITGTRIIRPSASRIDAFIKLFPDADGVLIDHPTSDADLRADGVFAAGSKNVTVYEPDLTARNENTVRATGQNGILAQRMRVIGGRVVHTGVKSAIDFRNCIDCVADGVIAVCPKDQSAIVIGDSHTGDPGTDNTRVERCQVFGGSIKVDWNARTSYVVGNTPRWIEKPSNCFLVVSAGARDTYLHRNAGPAIVGQKAMVANFGAVGVFEDVGNGWTAPPATQPTTRPIQ